MHIPDKISIDQIVLGERGRSSYNNIEDLAQSIADNGLIQPLVLVPSHWEGLDDGGHTMVSPVQMFGVDAGGRRYHALKHLGVTALFHATTSDPERPGFVLKGEDQGTPLERLKTEIAENLDRDDLDWRDEMKLLNKAWKLARADADSKSEKLLMRDFGAMIGCGYADLQAAVAIYEDVLLFPERYINCNGVRAAYSTLLAHNARELEREKVERTVKEHPLAERTEASQVSVQNVPEQEHIINVPLTQFFHNVNGINWMTALKPQSLDHIITDPDYGVSVERLGASIDNASQGVHQESVDQSLEDLGRFIFESWRTLKPQGFLVFWYDLDHHEKLQHMATDVGFAVQRWPLIWHKTDYRSNSAPQYNFCKNIEYAMVCRKPNAVLARVQTSSVYSCASGPIVKELGHPFAKPYELWQWLYSAVCIKGQVVADPFFGSGSMPIAALRWGLRPVGCEIVSEHYYRGLHNLQEAYKKELGNNITFS